MIREVDARFLRISGDPAVAIRLAECATVQFSGRKGRRAPRPRAQACAAVNKTTGRIIRRIWSKEENLEIEEIKERGKVVKMGSLDLFVGELKNGGRKEGLALCTSFKVMNNIL